jgi:hypothetical protein
MIYVILGMHKSGTTLVSQILHQSGIDMGEAFAQDRSYDEGNYYERGVTGMLNGEILWPYAIPTLGYVIKAKILRQRVLNQPPSISIIRKLPESLSPAQRVRMGQIIEDCSKRHEDWGFKDPKSCLTYHLWRQELPEHKVIAIFRHYQEFLLRYRVGGTNPLRLALLYRVLHAWTRHNLALIEAVEQGGAPTLLFNYRDFMIGDAVFGRLVDFVGRPLQDAREVSRYRNRQSDQADLLPVFARWMVPLLPADPRVIYRRLEEMAQAQASQL